MTEPDPVTLADVLAVGVIILVLLLVIYSPTYNRFIDQLRTRILAFFRKE